MSKRLRSLVTIADYRTRMLKKHDELAELKTQKLDDAARRLCSLFGSLLRLIKLDRLAELKKKLGEIESLCVPQCVLMR